MQFHWGAPPNSLSEEELASGEWHALPFPPVWALYALAVPVGAALALLTFAAWARFGSHISVEFAPFPQVAAVTVLVFFTGLGLQLAAQPSAGLGNRSGIGLWPSRVLPYTYYLGALSKRRFIAQLALPIVAIALLPLGAGLLLRAQSGWLVFISCVAAATFGTNALLALWAAVRLPGGATVAGRGVQPYWRMERSET